MKRHKGASYTGSRTGRTLDGKYTEFIQPETAAEVVEAYRKATPEQQETVRRLLNIKERPTLDLF